MKMEDLQARTVSLLDREPTKAVVVERVARVKVKRKGPVPMDSRGLSAQPIRRVPGVCDVYEGVPIPMIRQFKIPGDVSAHFRGGRRPWSKVEIGQSFFIPGVSEVGVRGTAGEWATRFVFLNGAPGMMVWRLK